MLNYSKLIDGLKNYKVVLSSIKEAVYNFANQYKVENKHAQMARYMKSTFNCPSYYIESSYMFLGKYHLEIYPFSGTFIKSSHRLLDLYPNILALDSDTISLKDTEITFDGSFCALQTSLYDINKDEMLFNVKFDSIALNFALDRISGGLEQIEKYLITLKSLLNNGGIIFGITTSGIGINHKQNALAFLQQQNKSSIWFNEQRDIKSIEDLFIKHFDDVATSIVGSCLIFRIAPAKVKVDTLAHKLDINNIEGKYLEL